MGSEMCIRDSIQEDELLEVTPKTIRLRKRILDPILRKRSANKIA